MHYLTDYIYIGIVPTFSKCCTSSLPLVISLQGRLCTIILVCCQSVSQIITQNVGDEFSEIFGWVGLRTTLMVIKQQIKKFNVKKTAEVVKEFRYFDFRFSGSKHL